MINGKLCPNCSKDIGVWPIVSAGLPNRIRCPHCMIRLRYIGTAAVNVVLGLILIAIVAGAYTFASSVTIDDAWRMRRVWASIVLIAWIPVELATAWFLRNRRELDIGDRTRGSPG